MVASLVSLLVLGLLVIVHEAGHFIVARWAGVRVLRFSMGFGPRLLTWRRGHTEYAVSAIPLGGYVKMAGEQAPAGTAQAGDPWEYLSKPISTRAGIVFAGPFVNYLVGLLSFWVVFVIGYPELLSVVGKVVEEMPAQAAGLQPGDRIAAIDGQPVETWEEMTEIIYDSPERPLRFQIEREGGEAFGVTIAPKAKASADHFGRPKTIGQIGISASGASRLYRPGPVKAVGETIKLQNEVIGQTMVALWLMVTGRLSMRESVTGPIGIVFMVQDALHLGLSSALTFVAIISLSLAIFNLFPLPILDGGHLLFLALEKLRGKPVSVTIQERSAQVSFVALLALVLVICINDVNRFGLVEKVGQWMRR